MQKEEDRQLKNGREILNQIKDLQGIYESYKVDPEEEELGFIDKINRLIQSIMGDSSLSVYEALNNQKLEKWHKKKISRWIKRTVFNNFKNLLYFLFLSSITGFLVSEAVHFYSIDGVADAKTYIKAILTEISFIFLSGYISKGKLEALWVGFLRTGVFCLMVFVISSQTLSTGTVIVSENAAIQEQIVFIEKQIKEKDKQIAYYEKKDWPKNLTRTTIEKETLIKKLIFRKDQQAAGKNVSVSEIEKYKTYGRAAFRVLLLFISVLITRRIFKF